MIRPTKKLTIFILLFCFTVWYGMAQVTTSLQYANFNTCGADLPQSELNLGDLTLTEGLATDFSIGTFTFYIQAPTNFEIDATTISETGTDITAATVVQDAGDPSRLEITLTANAQVSLDVVTIENVRILLVSGETTTDGNLTYTLDGNANNINALSDSQTLANISFDPLVGGTGVDQQVCAVDDVQNISVTNGNGNTANARIDDAKEYLFDASSYICSTRAGRKTRRLSGHPTFITGKPN